jgi:hypothetical protein
MDNNNYTVLQIYIQACFSKRQSRVLGTISLIALIYCQNLVKIIHFDAVISLTKKKCIIILFETQGRDIKFRNNKDLCSVTNRISVGTKEYFRCNKHISVSNAYEDFCVTYII